tara:strand:- start:141 stop:347 length:207 start_codon:yes stop_codon:yes gene_type:complete
MRILKSTQLPDDFWEDLPKHTKLIPVTGDWSHIPKERIYKKKTCPGCEHCKKGMKDETNKEKQTCKEE